MAHRVTIRRILCPTDYSDCASHALRRAVGLAGWFDARIRVLHVMGMAPAEAPVVGGGRAAVSEDVMRLREAEELARLGAFSAPAIAAGASLELKFVAGVSGDVSREICAEAEDSSADLVVMGTHGRTGLGHVMMGSVAERVLRAAPCPVLTVGAASPEAGDEPLFRRVLCATDLGAPASPTIHLAASVASETLACLTLLHVVEEPGAGPERPLAAHDPVRRALVEQARERLARLAVPARTFCRVTERVETGRAWREILRVAREAHADLIVVGAHGGGALGRLLLGSNANQVVRHAECPVLVARDRSALMEDVMVAAGHSAERRTQASPTRVDRQREPSGRPA